MRLSAHRRDQSRNLHDEFTRRSPTDGILLTAPKEHDVRAALQRTRRSGRPIGRGAARIAAPGTVLVLPATSPYEWELLREYVVASARQRDTIRLRVEGRDCMVRREPDPGRRCDDCGGAFLQVSFRIAARDVCLGCAQLRLTGAARDAEAFDEDRRGGDRSRAQSRPAW
jgi:hypothetical protein